MSRGLLAWLLCAVALTALAADLDYRLQPRQIAPDTWLVEGTTEFFDSRNGGNIANVVFIVTAAGVVVIDTGPSRRYGVQLRQAIAAVTDQPILAVYLTHHHPDHALGNQAFQDVPIYALPGTAEALREQGGELSANLYRLVGDWMQGTEVVQPTATVSEGIQEIGGHRLQFIALAGHSAGDLAILDHSTGVLVSAMVFNRRAPATPYSDLGRWLASLQRLQALDFRLLVPAAGPAGERSLIEHNADYLRWLGESLEAQAEAGVDMAEALSAPIPERFSDFALLREEYQRSVGYLYPALEQSALEVRR
ncbi:MAG TPA: quinoprotein relay system zinc metallohydrolase 1 [Candidatus Competibacteraceae bacterium]|nr:quinoprotein relay system zinc metallohydrolase 1 [Candidatus Competibacteraceae bacterium]